jgi:hypothetical protein
MLADEALFYSDRMLELGDERGRAQRDHALGLIAQRDSVERSLLLSYVVISLAAALLMWALRLGTLARSSALHP